MPLPIQRLQRDEIVRGPLLISDAQVKQTRTGKNYLDLKVRDASGQVAAKMWQISPELEAELPSLSVIWVTARVDEFNGRPQLILETIEPYVPTDEEYRDLIPTSAWPAPLLWTEIRRHLQHEITDPALWRLMEAVLDHPDIVSAAPTIPAASRNHHAYRAGLAEHVLSMLRLSATVVRHYESYYPYPIHRGLLAAGVLLHDIGKIWELSGDVDASYTDEGRLLGHIFMAARWIEDVARPLDIPRPLIVELQHLILSHHGKLEFGSPKRPKTIEAMVLHHIDKLDADMNQWMAELSQPGWTGYVRNYERPLFRPDAMRETWTHPAAFHAPARGPGLPIDLRSDDTAMNAPPADASSFSPSTTNHGGQPTSASTEDAPEPSASGAVVPPAPKKTAKRSPKSEANKNDATLSAPPVDSAPEPPPFDDDLGSLSLFDGLPFSDDPYKK